MRPEDILSQIRSLTPTIRDKRAVNAARKELCADLMASLYEVGLGGLWLPKDVGGCDVGLLDSYELFSLIATADPSVAWNVAHGAYHNLLLQATFPDSFERFIVLTKLGSGATCDEPTQAVPERGGLRLNGVWQFCSASEQSQHTLLGAPLVDRNAIQYACVKTERLLRLNNWNTVGLRGTNSQSVEAKQLWAEPDECGILALGQAGQIVPAPRCLVRLQPYGVIYMVCILSVAIGALKDLLEQCFESSRKLEQHNQLRRLEMRRFAICNIEESIRTTVSTFEGYQGTQTRQNYLEGIAYLSFLLSRAQDESWSLIREAGTERVMEECRTCQSFLDILAVTSHKFPRRCHDAFLKMREG